MARLRGVKASTSHTRREPAERVLGAVRSCRARRRAFRIAIHAVALMLPATAPSPSIAQQAARPQPDLGRTERYFDVIEREQTRAKKPVLLPSAARPAVTGDTRPLFLLAGITVAGATALSDDAIAATYRD